MDIVLNGLKRLGAFYADKHFVLKSGKHSEAYINPDVALMYPSVVHEAAQLMAWPFKDERRDIVCVGPAFGGNFMAWSVAEVLGRFSGYDIRWVATAKSPGGGFIIEPDRGFEDLLLGGAEPASVLVAEDLLTTGGSVKELISSLSDYFVKFIGVTAEDLGVPVLHSAANITVETDEPRFCRWCAMERPIVEDVGHGLEYKLAHPDYVGGYIKLLS